VLSQLLLIRHLLNIMHYEKNLCENIVKIIYGEKDYARARIDMKDMLIRPELWLQPKPNKPDEFFMPRATYVLSADEKKKKMLEDIADM
jgi:hypothetical protein